MKRSKWIIAGLILFVFAAAAAGLALMPSPSPPAPVQYHVAVEPPPAQEPASAPPPIEAPSVAPTTPISPPPEPAKPALTKPRIAIIIDDMGLDISGAERATNLPAFVTLSFMPYARHLKEQTQRALADGHELMLHMPMEPLGHDDPGPGALLTGLPPEELRARLDKALDSFSGFDGVNNHMGSKFTANADDMELVMGELKPRHLFFLDSRTSGKSVGESVARHEGLPTIGRDVFLDDTLSADSIKAQLAETEAVAKRKGYAIAIGHPHQVTLEALEAWLPDAETRFDFVPVRELIGNVPPSP